MSASRASIRSAPGFSRSRESMSGELSMPTTRTPRSASGSAIRPGGTANSSAAPSPASSASRDTAGVTTAGSNIGAEWWSYNAATRSVKNSPGMRKQLVAGREYAIGIELLLRSGQPIEVRPEVAAPLLLGHRQRADGIHGSACRLCPGGDRAVVVHEPGGLDRIAGRGEADQRERETQLLVGNAQQRGRDCRPAH